MAGFNPRQMMNMARMAQKSHEAAKNAQARSSNRSEQPDNSAGLREGGKAVAKMGANMFVRQLINRVIHLLMR